MADEAEPRRFLTSLFKAAVAAADPLVTLRDHLPERPKGRTVVVGAGKGSAQMAAALETLWDGPLEGVVVTRYGYAAPCRSIEVLEASHPVPDEAGLRASARLTQAVSGLTADDLVIALISGGGSALLPAPAGSLTLADEIAVNEALLASGAPISAMNAVRKHVSAIKGGRLAAAAHPARVVSLVVSDIPGDDPALVASGPTVPDATTREEALKIVEAYGIALPAAVTAHLASPAAEAPRPDDPRFANQTVQLIASAGVSLEAAAAAARRQGVEAVILSDSIEGEARVVGAVHAAIAREVARRDRPFATPGGDPLRRRDDRYRARQGQGRPQQRIPAGLGARHRGPGGHRCAGRRHRRHRRIGGQCWRLRRWRHDGAHAGRRRRSAGGAGGQRRVERVRRRGRPVRAGTDRHQRQRFPGDLAALRVALRPPSAFLRRECRLGSGALGLLVAPARGCAG